MMFHYLCDHPAEGCCPTSAARKATGGRREEPPHRFSCSLFLTIILVCSAGNKVGAWINPSRQPQKRQQQNYKQLLQSTTRGIIKKHQHPLQDIPQAGFSFSKMTRLYEYQNPSTTSNVEGNGSSTTTTAAASPVSSSGSQSVGGAQQDEKTLKAEIRERGNNNWLNDNEEFAVADGAYLEQLSTTASLTSSATDGQNSNTFAATSTSSSGSTTSSSSTSSSSSSSLQDVMDRITKPRPYGWFLMEKAAELVESTIAQALAPPSPSSTIRSWENNNMGSSGSSTMVKERLVVLGTGWAAMSFLKDINTDLYDVTVISPRNHFVFTPMLAGASVGTVEFRSICEPIREFTRNSNYLEATATAINPTSQTVTCESVVCDGNSCEITDFTIPYDKLIFTIGAQTNTFGIPGVRENCNFLKNVEDARRIRTAIVNCFERANLPGLSDLDREHALTFAIIGAGPTGIEVAAELRDFVEQDGPKYYPQLIKFVRIKVIEASATVLAPFDKKLQQEAIKQLNRPIDIQDAEVRATLPPDFQIEQLLLESSVQEVTEKEIVLKDGRKIAYGMSIWAAGNGPLPLTMSLIDTLGQEQRTEQAVARGRLAIDPWMRVIGSEGKILAFGDCSCCINRGAPQLPATAQVAAQQGEYLANLLNRKYEFSPLRNEDGVFPPPHRDPARTEPSLSDNIAAWSLNNHEYARPFQFLNLGILAYTGGGTALAQITPAPDTDPVTSMGQIGNALWRSVYLSKQVSWRNRFLVLNDWTKRQLFGRDITRL